MKQAFTSYLKLHIAVLLFGYTAIFGRLISIDAGAIVWYRMLIGAVGFLFIPSLYRSLRSLNRKTAVRIAATGVLLMLHWVTFFAAIKASNVSVTLCFISTHSFFTALIEPALFRRKPDLKEVLLSLLILPGIYLVYRFSSAYLTGIILATIGAVLGALFGTINKKFIEKTNSMTVSFIELSSGWLSLTLLLPLYFLWEPESSLRITSWNDFGNLLVLAILCTTIAYRLSVDALRHMSAFTVSMSINMEPIYGIVLAALYFKEHEKMDSGFYWGAALIIFAVFLDGFIKYRLRRKRNTRLKV